MADASPTQTADAGRAYIGLAVLGWGLSILLQVTPHEDPIVGGALTVFGIALLATAPRLPRLGRAPPLLLGLLGGGALVTVVGYNLVFDAGLDAPKIALLVLGALLLAAAFFVDRTVRMPLRGRPHVPVGTLAGFLLPVLGAPLAVWGVQAAFKGVVGTTPIEAFIQVGLLVPLEGLLWLFGWNPIVADQTITYATPRGPLSVDVGAACSGVQAMALFAGVLALFLIAERPGGRRLALWSAIGIVGVYVTNLLRLATLVVVGHQWGSAALVRTHAEAGWIFFVAWAILFARLARTPARRRPPPVPTAAGG